MDGTLGILKVKYDLIESSNGPIYSLSAPNNQCFLNLIEDSHKKL